MAATITPTGDQAVQHAPAVDWLAAARELAPGFASRAPACDANDSFVAENYGELREHRVFSAGVPAELGGGGATYAELCAFLQEIARSCGSTALALGMHTQLVATMVWAWRQGQPVAPRLERIAVQQLVLVTTGAADWLDSSGTAERVDGGYRIMGRKAFRPRASAVAWGWITNAARVRHGRIIEEWGVVDQMAIMCQRGLIGETEPALAV
jgi:alkylation response protein AidB-like acyl-CoA dehydrogenase